eukprot:10931516-Ditylum_brightwellii.AAC.1
MSTVKNHVNKCMAMKKVPTQLISSGSNNTYSPWARASYCWAKRLAIHYGTIDPYTYKDPKMPPVLPGTNPDWVALYLYDEETNKERPQRMIAEVKEKMRMCPLYAAQPRLPILLP